MTEKFGRRELFKKASVKIGAALGLLAIAQATALVVADTEEKYSLDTLSNIVNECFNGILDYKSPTVSYLENTMHVVLSFENQNRKYSIDWTFPQYQRDFYLLTISDSINETNLLIERENIVKLEAPGNSLHYSQTVETARRMKKDYDEWRSKFESK